MSSYRDETNTFVSHDGLLLANWFCLTSKNDCGDKILLTQLSDHNVISMDKVVLQLVACVVFDATTPDKHAEIPACPQHRLLPRCSIAERIPHRG